MTAAMKLNHQVRASNSMRGGGTRCFRSNQDHPRPATVSFEDVNLERDLLRLNLKPSTQLNLKSSTTINTDSEKPKHSVAGKIVRFASTVVCRTVPSSRPLAPTQRHQKPKRKNTWGDLAGEDEVKHPPSSTLETGEKKTGLMRHDSLSSSSTCASADDVFNAHSGIQASRITTSAVATEMEAAALVYPSQGSASEQQQQQPQSQQSQQQQQQPQHRDDMNSSRQVQHQPPAKRRRRLQRHNASGDTFLNMNSALLGAVTVIPNESVGVESVEPYACYSAASSNAYIQQEQYEVNAWLASLPIECCIFN